jgi:prophage antirepressor-like protein
MKEQKKFNFKDTVINTKKIDGQTYFLLLDVITACEVQNNFKRFQDIFKKDFPQFLKIEETETSYEYWINELGVYQIAFKRNHAEDFIKYISDNIYPYLRSVEIVSNPIENSEQDIIKKMEKIIDKHRTIGNHFKTPESKIREIISKDIWENLGVDFNAYVEHVDF